MNFSDLLDKDGQGTRELGEDYLFGMKARFWSFIEVQNPTSTYKDCWLWQGSIADGYGTFSIKGYDYRAHRISLFLYKDGFNLNKMVCHKCDNRNCVNPKHLYVGTASENMQDAWDWGNKKKKNGEENPHSKLTEEDVKEIRRRYENEQIYQYELADEYGISQNHVSDIVNRELWDHV